MINMLIILLILSFSGIFLFVVYMNHLDKRIDELDKKIYEEPNLESLWHDAFEEPQYYPIICKDEQNYVWTEYSLNDYVDGWADFVDFNEISNWAYVSDLLPKGGKK